MTTEESIYLKDYDPKWPIKFEAEKQLIKNTLGSGITGGIHHVGSTAVPNLRGKPIIDIMVGVEKLEPAKAFIPLLEKVAYVYFPYKPEIMHWFCKPSPAHREFHLYLMEPSSPQWKGRLLFRDQLREHPETAKKYLILKEDLAAKFQNDREAYTQGKTDFVKSVVGEELFG
jgi:GrpB-like predicted nucleotidyltransferase (UPF0157 family)